MNDQGFALLSMVLGHRKPEHLAVLSEEYQKEIARRKDLDEAQVEELGDVPDPALLVADTAGSNTPSQESPLAATPPSAVANPEPEKITAASQMERVRLPDLEHKPTVPEAAAFNPAKPPVIKAPPPPPAPRSDK